METTKHSTPNIVPKRDLKGKDGREPFAEKIARANEILERYGLPKEIVRRQEEAAKLNKESSKEVDSSNERKES